MQFERTRVITGPKSTKLPALLLFALIFVTGGAAQNDNNSQATEYVRAEFKSSKQILAPGETVSLKIILRFADGAHANSNAPSDAYLIPTSFSPVKNDHLEWGAVEYPEPTEAIASYSPTPLEVFEDGAEIKVSGRILDDVKEGPLKVEGSLRIQVCDDQQCYPPKRIPLSVSVKISKPKVTQRSKNRKP